MEFKFNGIDRLQEKLDAELKSMGLSPEFTKNLAYQDTLDRIRSELRSVEDAKQLGAYVNTYTEKNRIYVTSDTSRKWTDGAREMISIFLEGENILRVTKQIDYNPIRMKDGKTEYKKGFFELETRRKNDGFMTITENNAVAYSDNLAERFCENSVSASKATYDELGIMKEYESRNFPSGRLEQSIKEASFDSAIFLARTAFNFRPYIDYSQRVFVRRQAFDVAFISVEDRQNNFEFHGELPMNNEHGIRRINVQPQVNFLVHYGQIAIPKMTDKEITEILEKEQYMSPEVEERLKQMAEYRKEYTYDSREDPHFINTYASSLEQGQKLPR